MKSLIVGLSVVGMLATAAPALAANNTVPGCQVPPDHGIYDEFNYLVGCIKADAWNTAMANQWHTMIGALPTFAAGESVRDEHGVVYECPLWFYLWRCVDVTRTPEYRAYMQDFARQLIKTHTNLPAFAGWVASVR